jgi:predicted protein tyrosine phosphatase
MTKRTLTQKIFDDNGCPYANPYQGTSTRLLFVCSAGLLRSPTAANVATKLGFNARSCGSADYALIGLSINLIEWADKIIFVNPANKLEAYDTFSVDDYYTELLRNKSVCWNIEDEYEYGHPDLIAQVTRLIEDF